MAYISARSNIIASVLETMQNKEQFSDVAANCQWCN